MTVIPNKKQVRIKSVNWHLTTRCNYKCKFCFAQELDSEITDLENAKSILEKLRDWGIEKINFVGGEPMLHPLIFDITEWAKCKGFVVSVVSNGYYLNKDNIVELSKSIDWLGLSIDSASEEIETTLGRGNGSHVKHVLELASAIHQTKIKLKINTVVTRLNWIEDMRPLIQRLKPDRWKVFQVLHIRGQNDCFFNDLSISHEQFNHFRATNQEIIGVAAPVFEANSEMIDSYFMLSPGGMAMSNREGTNRILTPLEGIDHQGFDKVVDVKKYVERGGIYTW